MGGSRFEDISFSIYHLRDDPDSRFIAGDIFHPCENCQQTFKEILENLGGKYHDKARFFKVCD